MSFLDGGTTLISAFSVGRTQELLYELEEIIHRIDSDKLFSVQQAKQKSVCDYLEIIVKSSLAAKFTTQYRELKLLWDGEARRKVSTGRPPLGFELILTIDSHKEHMDTVGYLRKTGRPAIVIAASGVRAGGRIQNYFKALLPDKRTYVGFVGCQASGIPRRNIQRYGAKVSGKSNGYVILDGERITINAQVHTLSGYSAHADQKDLVNFVKRMRHKPRHIRIVHGARWVLRRLY